MAIAKKCVLFLIVMGTRLGAYQADTLESFLQDQRKGADNSYLVWLDSTHEQWKMRSLVTCACRLLYILDELRSCPNKGQAVPQEYLYGYNFIRNFLHRPSAERFTQVDETWLADVYAHVRLYQFLEQERFKLPNDDQIKQLQEAQSCSGVQGTICLAVCPNRGSWTYVDAQDDTCSYMALCSSAQPSVQLFSLYHELCHVLHHDSRHSVTIKKGTAQPKDFLSDNAYAEHRKSVSTYLQLAKRALDDSTAIGKRMKSFLARRALLWLPPVDVQSYEKTLYFRYTEQRADLFACQQLLKQNRIDAIVGQLIDYALSDYTIAETDKDTHPCDLERALYVAGFLLAHAVDLNHELLQFCERELPSAGSGSVRSLTQGAQDFIKAYEEWREQREKVRYNQWKDHVVSVAQQEGVSSRREQLQSLAAMALNEYNLALGEYTKASYPVADHEQLALYCYNFLRDLCQESRVATFEELDTAWVKEQLNLI